MNTNFMPLLGGQRRQKQQAPSDISRKNGILIKDITHIIEREHKQN